MSLSQFIMRTRLLLAQGLHDSRRAATEAIPLETLELLQLEERVLLSATPAAVAVEAAQAAATATESVQTGSITGPTDQQMLDIVADSTLPHQSSTSGNNDSTEDDGTGDSHTLELVFIDSRVQDVDALIADLQATDELDDNRTLEIIALDSQQDGIAAITSTLLQYNGVDGIHIVSHGADGRVQLGSATLSLETLDTYRSAISGWSHSLSDQADLLFYGCDLAATDEGQALMNKIAAECGCDVAASEDLTGHESLGGDWDLEYQTGTLESEIAFSQRLQEAWYFTLDTVNLNPTQDTWLNAGDTNGNFGTSTSLTVDRNGVGLGNGRALLQFDISSVPIGATINSATLTLNATANGSAFHIRVYEVTEAWDEGNQSAGGTDTASWDDRQDGTSWSMTGGTVDPTIIDTVDTAATGLHNWDITSLVQAWYTGTSTNNGLMLASPDSGSTTVTYDSREGGVSPVLSINYTPGPEWSITGDSSLNEGQSASYTISLTGNQDATVDLALTDIDTSGGDYADFDTAVNAAVAAHENVTFNGSTFKYTPLSYDSTASNFADISGTGTALGLGDDSSSLQSIGFNFDFYGSTYSQLYVDSNGYVTFGGSHSDFTNKDFSAGNTINNLPAIAAFWDDLDPSDPDSDDVYVQTIGTPGSREFIVQYNNVVPYNGNAGEGITFQLVLFEGSNEFEIRYQDVIANGTNDDGASATIGVSDGSGAYIQHSFNTAAVTSGSHLHYTPSMDDVTISLAINDDGVSEANEDFSVVLSSATGSSLTSSSSVTTTITNQAPVLSGANNLTTISEDDFSNGGTLVSTILSGNVSDGDSGSLSGIAVIAVDDTDGTWEYTTNGGGVWTAFGSVSLSSARLLAVDANTSVRFVPDANWNGTVSNGITFHSWDQTTDSAGSTVDLTGTLAAVTSEFASYTDGSNWNGNWTEVGESDGSSSGNVQLASTGSVIAGGGSYLRMDLVSGMGLERAVDLSAADSATISFYYEQNDVGSGGEFAIQSWNGSTWTSIQTFAINSDNYSGNSGVYTGELTITDPASVTKIRIYTTSASSGGADIAYIDDLQITPGYNPTGGSTAYSTSTASSDVTVNPANDIPTLTSFAAPVDTTNEDTQVELTFADLAAQGNEADSDGTVDGFVVQSISSGTLLIGTSAGTATAWAAGTNDTIDATNNAYWTPASNANGTLTAFEVVAIDDDGAESASNVAVQVTVNDVNDIPTLTSFAAPVDTTNEDTQVELTFAELAAQGNEADSDGTVDGFVVQSVSSGTLLIGTSAGTATAWAAGTNDTIDATNHAYWTPASNANGTLTAFEVVAIDDDGAESTTNVAVQVTVNDVNDIPTLTSFATPVDTTNEDTQVELTFAELVAQGNEADSDGTVDGFVVQSISSGTLLIGTSAGTATAWAAGTNDTIDTTNNVYWTPANNANGTLTAFEVVAIDDDGAESTTNVAVQVTVTPSNDAPTITAIGDQTINEDDTTGALAFSVNDVETAAGVLSVTASSSNTTIIPNGNLTLIDLGSGNWTIEATPALNQNGGPVTITVTVNDGTTTTDETFDVTITPQNDAPILDLNGADGGGVNHSDSYIELGGPVNVTDTDATISDVDDSSHLGLSINLASGFADGASERIRINGVTFSHGVSSSTTTIVGSTTFDFAFDGISFAISRFGGGTMPTSDLEALIQGIDYQNVSLNPTGGARTFDFTVEDAGGLSSATASSTISVSGINTRPTFTSFSGPVDSTNEDSEVEVTFAELAGQGNEFDVDGTVDSFIVKSVTSGTLLIGTSSGTATAWAAGTNDTINSTLNAYWTPANNANGTLNAFAVVAKDDGGLESLGSVTAQVTVNDINDIPTLTSFAAPVDTTNEDTQVELTFAELAVQGNEADSDGTVDGFVVQSISSGTLLIGTSAGTATAWAAGTNDTIDATNHAYWTPASNANGTLTAFEVVAIDDDGAESASNVAVQVTVNDVNDIPTLTTFAAPVDTTNEDTQVELTFAELAAQGNEADIDGTVDGFVVQSVSSGTLLIGTSAGTATAWAAGTNDTIDATNHAYWTPASNANGTLTAFEVVAIDDDGGESTTNVAVQVTVNDVNDIPTLTNFAAPVDTTNEDTQAELTFAELAAQGNEADIDGTVDGFVVQSVSSGTLLIGTSAGTATAWAAGTNDTIDASNNAYWTPANNANGTLTAFEVVAIDDDGGESATNVAVQVSVAPVNDDPVVAINTGMTVNEGSTANGISSAMLNEGDPDDSGAGLTYTVTSVTPNGTLRNNGTALGLNDTFTQADINSGLITYDHDGSETISDSFDFSLADGGEDGITPATGTFNITVTPVNDAPVITQNSLTISEGQTVVLSNSDLNATDAEQSAAQLTYTVATVNQGQFEFVAAPTVAITSFTQDDINTGKVQFVHDGGEIAPSYQFILFDGTDLVGPNAATVSFTNVNDNPYQDGIVPQTINEGDNITLDAGSWADPDGGPLTYTWDLDGDSIYGEPGEPTGSSPVVSWSTLESFGIDDDGNYTVWIQADDGNGGTGIGIMSITVVNVAPTAGDDSGVGYVTDEDTAFNTIDVRGNDTDPASGDPLTVISFDVTGTVGTVIDNGDGTFNYDPNGLFESLGASDSTTDSFTYTVSDGDGGTDTATVTITIDGVNDSPLIGTNTGMTVNEGSSANTITTAMLNEGDVDDDGTELTYTVTANVSRGTLSLAGFGTLTIFDTFTQDDIDNNRVSYTHDGSETTIDGFAFSLADGGEDGSSPTAGAFAINITPVNDAPVITEPGAQVMNEGTPLSFDVGVNEVSFSDVDATSLTVTLTADDGYLTLGSLTGLSFTVGDGSADETMTFSGTIGDINAAVDGLQYANDINHDGIGSVDILISDNGQTGLGGTLTDSATISITINTPAPPPVVGDAFLQGNYLQIGLGADGAFGSDGNAPVGYALAGQQLALSSDPDKDGFGTYDGDFVLPGSPEEGWGVHVGGVSYNNNNNILSPEISGALQNLQTSAAQESVDWAGSVAGLDVDKTYSVLADELYVDVVVSLTNNSGSTMNDVYYMRNADPDNNQSQGVADVYTTTNTIVSQGNDGSGQAVVTATQSDGSYMAIVGYGGNARVTRGGFANRNAVDVFNGTGGLNNTGTSTDDFAISLAYHVNSIADGETVTLHYRYYLGQESIPSLDLDADNSQGATGGDLLNSFTEDAGAVAVADTDATITDLDSINLTGLTATITNLLDGANESLSVNTGASGIVANYAGGTLTLTGSASVADYQSVLRTLTYDNSSQAPSTTDRVIEITVTDGVNTSPAVTATVSINAVNDAPVLTAASPTFTAISEDDTSNGGDTVASILGASVTDVDAGAVEGVAVTSLDNSNGQWEYSTDGLTWNAVGTVSQTNSLLLRAIDRLRFVPDTIDSDAATVTYRAWDQTTGVSGTKVNVSLNGGITAFSSSQDTASITVTAINDAPVLTVPGTQTIFEETQTPIAGIGISDIDDRGLTMSVKATVTNGIVILDLSGGATVSVGANSSADMTITGTETQLNAALASLEYLPDLDVRGSAADTLTLIVSDLGNSGTGGPLNDTQTITIDVLNVNDEEILATNTGLTVSEGDVGTTITQAMLETTDVDNTPDEIVYRLTDVSTTGILRLSGTALSVLDTFTQAHVNAGLLTYDHNDMEVFTDSFDFNVNDGGGTSTNAVFSISITPVNDNDPVITSNGGGATASLSIAENSPGVTVVTAIDSDLPVQIMNYSIVGGTDSGRFSIDSLSGDLSFVTAPDFEIPTDANTDNVYEVVVQVSDGQGRTDQQTLTITVTDVDEYDVTSITDSDVTLDTVNENAAIGTAVGITAFSDDADGTDTVDYTLDDDAGGLFAIDSVTGVVTTAAAIDYETVGATTNITVRATSTDDSTTTRTFVITINDVDEFDVTPIIDNDGAADNVTENVAIGTTVGITAFSEDLDGTTNVVSYSLDDNAGGLFAIDSATGIVTTAAAIDYETIGASTNITARATSTDGSTATRTFTITFNDVDEFDVTPIVDTDAAADNVTENVAIGTTVGITAFSEDLDGTTNVVSYTLDDDAGGLFTIDSVTGVVTTAAAIDYESVGTSTSITVRATSTDDSTTTRTFTITINDVDEFDVTPIIDTDATADNITENVAVGTAVGITAFSEDLDGTTNVVSYSLDDDAGGLFAIDSVTGVVTTAAAIDYETVGASTSITARATSTDGSTTTRTFTIIFTDVDEFDVVSIVDVDATVDAVDENAVVGTVVGITAFSEDLDGTNNIVSYSLDDDAGGLFAIDSGTGQVTVSGAIDREISASHTITVRATSTDGSTTTRNFTIAVNDIDEFDVTPLVDIDATANLIDENVAVRTNVGITAFSQDVDATTNSVTYSLDDNAGGLFTIDSATGIITTAAAIDYETTSPIQSIVVRATSADTSTTTQSFTITITDLDEFDVSVIVDVDAVSNSVDENLAAGAVVGLTAFSEDLDGTTNAITYSLDDDAGGRFAIDAGTGIVTTATSLNHELLASHTIVIRATSADSSTITQSFVINVNDINEAPVAVADDFTSDQLEVLTVDPGTLQLNDSDVDGDSLTVVLVSGPTDGTLMISADGSFTYEPDDVFAGIDSFTYYVTDGSLDSNTVTVTLNINAVVSSSTSESTDSGPDDGPDSGSDVSEPDSKDSADSTDESPDDTTSPDSDVAPGTNSSGTTSHTSSNAGDIIVGLINTAGPDSGIHDLVGYSETNLINVVLIAVPEAETLTRYGIESGFEEVDLDGLNLRSSLFNQIELNGTAFAAVFLQTDTRVVTEPQEQQEETFRNTEKVVVGTTAVVSTSVSVGYVIWMLRGGSLLTTFLSSLPAWQSFDPLPILDSFDKESAESDNESLESLVGGNGNDSQI